ncbi:ribbon-helix-helix protein, CopG family [Paenirhodobacter sp. CAU 1674]|uniref:ribbon-helix-helix protein, CopG family n=1 Tax=Paenirhodobacter sp. CAU 1674 TaxID=3032596 RepID=UPI0023DBA2F7|nr:ribbon-helix-helix protein, CopG family [Paenirhodobacter sp. CAU 1674]MDF2143268.1 ribbon-helix-helix protein, CopG family [Paenirhodobacter sp. CAU 1674]
MAKMGRPKVDGENIMLRLPTEMIVAIDELRKQSDELPTRQEIVRRALADYLRARGMLGA